VTTRTAIPTRTKPVCICVGDGTTSANHESVKTGSVDYKNHKPDYLLSVFNSANETGEQSTSSTTYTEVLSFGGGFVPGNIPSNMTIAARFIADMRNDTQGETTFAVPYVFKNQGNSTQKKLTAAEISVTDKAIKLADSGWVDISNDIDSPDQIHTTPSVDLKVSGGTGTIRDYASLKIGGFVK